MVHDSEHGMASCASTWKEPHEGIYVCPVGFCDFSIPIILPDGKVLGKVLAGQALSVKQKDEEILQKVAALGIDENKVRAGLRKGLAQDYYLPGREWPYKDIPRKIICEKYMTDYPGSPDFTDYKFFCFNGKVDCVMLCLERSSGDTKFYFFDRDWSLKRYNIRGISAPEGFTLPKPENIDKMFAKFA